MRNTDIDIEALALAVIKMAIEDATLDPSTARGKDKTKKEKLKQEAIIFLTSKNGMLRYWCEIGNINYDAVKKTLASVHNNREYWINILKEVQNGGRFNIASR